MSQKIRTPTPVSYRGFLFFVLYMATRRVAIYSTKNKDPLGVNRGFLFFVIYMATRRVAIYITKNKDPPFPYVHQYTVGPLKIVTIEGPIGIF